MAPTTNEAQRAEFHKTIWRIANDLRSSVDGRDVKSYVLRWRRTCLSRREPSDNCAGAGRSARSGWGPLCEGRAWRDVGAAGPV